MPQQEIMFTACPRARTADGLELSVFISPKLDPGASDGVLGDFPDLLTWAETVQAIDWWVSVDDVLYAAEPVGDPPNPVILGRIYNGQTPVRAHPFPDYTSHLIYSYPAGNLVDLLEGLYQQVATAYPEEHPPVDFLIDETTVPDVGHLVPDGAGGWRDDRRPRRAALAAALRTQGALAPAGPDPAGDSFQLWYFHQPGSIEGDPVAPDPDFAEVLAMLSEHFTLLRTLGFVIDLHVEGTFGTGVVDVQVRPSWEPQLAGSTDVLPITRAVVGTDDFRAQPQEVGAIVDGYLPLHATDAYRLIQVDQDGGILGLSMLARSLFKAKMLPTVDTKKTEPLPTLRSGGMSVARTGQAAHLRDRIERGFQLQAALANGGGPPIVYAEDLVVGTRWDVWMSLTGQWHSLQYRETDYDFISHPAEHLEISEEAAVVETPTSRHDGEDDHDDLTLNAQETLMRWDGWSLAAPRPGRTVVDDVPTDHQNEPPDGYPLRITPAAAPGSLPRLRFGEEYRLRARTVDLAGNSVPLEDPRADTATQPSRYLRYEPVDTPPVLLRHPRSPGESIEHVVLRSNHEDADDADPEQPAERHIVPPRSAQRTAEEHGMYDVNGGLDVGAYAAIVAREAETLAPTAGNGGVHDSETDHPYFPGAPFPVLYLPDPMARGLSFVPEVGDEVLVGFDHGEGWPHATPVRLVLDQGAGAPWVEEGVGERVLHVALPKAERVVVRFSCYLDEDDLERSAIWRLMLVSDASDATKQQWKGRALEGRLWMITPYRTMTLVHAVRQPLKPPAFLDLSALRDPGDTHARLQGQLDFSRKSTSRIDLHAHWGEPVDDGPGGGVPADPPRYGDDLREHDDELTIPLRLRDPEDPELDPDLLPLVDKHEFQDTKRRIITYTALATSAFTEYFDEEADVTRSSHEADEEAHREFQLDIPSSARPAAPKVLYAVPTHRWTRSVMASGAEGGGLRIYLDRPFMETGVRQLLGVVLDRDPAGPDDALASYTTRWGFDPLHPPVSPAAPSSPSPTVDDFPLAVGTESDDALGVDGAGRVHLNENGAEVSVVGHEVHFNEDRGLWFCDVEIDAGGAYMPFIRLALASYQPHSVGDLHISRVVLADIVQLTPDRTTTIVFGAGGGSVEISVVGQSPPDDGGRRASVMTATLESRLESDDEMLGWQPVSGAGATATLVPQDATGEDRGLTLWTATLRLPPTRRHGGQEELRIAVEEWQSPPVTEDRDPDETVRTAEREDDASGGPLTGRGPSGSEDPAPRLLRFRDLIPLSRTGRS